jgi:hypothetical protein
MLSGRGFNAVVEKKVSVNFLGYGHRAKLTPQAVHLQPDPHWQVPGPEHVQGPMSSMI